MSNILILGATSAIAAEMTRRYSARGERLFLVGRNAAKLEQLAAHGGSGVVGSACADFDDSTTHVPVVQQARDALGGLDLVVMAHGDLGDQPRSETDAGHAEQIIRTNFTSGVSLIVAVSACFEAQGHGALGVISSVAGERGRPKNYTYGAAKSGLSTYLEGLRSRWWGKHPVTCIRLGPVVTPMTDGHQKNALFATKERAARDIIRAFDGGRRDVFVPWYWRPIMAVVRSVPQALFQRVGFLSGND